MKTDSNESEEPNLLSDNKIDVDIEPDVKANRVTLQLCYLSLVFNCFSWNRPSRDPKSTTNVSENSANVSENC
jgi:hypothetical protein